MVEAGNAKGLAGRTHAQRRGEIEEGRVDGLSSMEGWQQVQLAVSGMRQVSRIQLVENDNPDSRGHSVVPSAPRPEGRAISSMRDSAEGKHNDHDDPLQKLCLGPLESLIRHVDPFDPRDP